MENFVTLISFFAASNILLFRFTWLFPCGTQIWFSGSYHKQLRKYTLNFRMVAHCI